MRSIERNARLLEASSGDADHAARIDKVVGDLAEHAVIPCAPDDVDESAGQADVIRLPRLHPVDWLDDGLVDEERVSRRPVGFVTSLVLGALAWIVLASVAFGVWELVSWLVRR